MAVADARSDVALELPTGAGKTLVGLLIALWRLKSRRQRVAYLCPTVQLGRQVAAQAKAYGIEAVDLTGPSQAFGPGDLLAFNRSQAIGIATYSSVFNTNPRIVAQTLVLDDAHAGEGPVADMWSVRAERGVGGLYDALLGVLIDTFAAVTGNRLRDPDLDPALRRSVDLVPALDVLDRADLLREALTEFSEAHNHFAFRTIGESLDTCLVYVSWSEILIRPFIPPTVTHSPFAAVDQRVYMSATLGFGGELERAFGIPAIHRIPAPAGWDDHGTGRRFFLFTSAENADQDAEAAVRALVGCTSRALVITPSNWQAQRARRDLIPEDTATFDAKEYERDPKTFLGADPGVLVVANRYDGMDLPDEACRLIVLAGLPYATHLQERFLYERLRAREVLNERIRTRLVQGAGRCTRNDQDFAAVVMEGDRVLEFFSREENVRALHPELQAEIAFGLDNSAVEGGGLVDRLSEFLAQSDRWAAADAEIERERAARTRDVPHASDALQRSASGEVQAWQEAWRGDFRAAAELALEAANHLGGGADLRPYRSLWLYLAWSWMERAELQEPGAIGAERRAGVERDVQGCVRTLNWVPRLRSAGPASQGSGSEFDARAVNAADWLRRWIGSNQKFERVMQEVTESLESDQARDFERGLALLGTLLGFESCRPDGQAEPDGVWRNQARWWFLFEAKTEESPDGSTSVETVRQALTHHDWVTGNMDWEGPESSMTVLVTHRRKLDAVAATLAGDLRRVDPAVVRALGAEVVAVHRELRPRARTLSDEQLVHAFSTAFRSRRLDDAELERRLGAFRLVDCDVPGGA